MYVCLYVCIHMTVQAKTSLVYTSDFAKLKAYKTGMLHKVQILISDKVMSNLLRI